MSIHLKNELENIKSMIQKYAGEVELAVNKAVKAVTAKDTRLAKQVIDYDRTLDLAEVDNEEECLKILALYQPVAIDLRYVTSCLKINNDLERVGDLAAKIAKVVPFIVESEINVEVNLTQIMQESQAMLKDSLDSLFNMDADLAMRVCENDDVVDDMKKELFSQLKTLLTNERQECEIYLHYFSLVRSLERIADYATNIAEDVIYLIQGVIVRHKI